MTSKNPRYTLRPGTAIFTISGQLWLFCSNLKPFRVTMPEIEARAVLDDLAQGHISEFNDIHRPLLAELLESHYLVDSSLWDTFNEAFDRQIRYLSCQLPAGRVPLAQRSLITSHVVVLGVGSLGSAVTLQLAAAGCQNFTLIDDDAIEPSNLARQITFTRHDLETKKVHAVRRLIESVVSSGERDTGLDLGPSRGLTSSY
ncbi:MAG: HesA/MoeB/ThiF family protein [Pseudonocardiaceae bacterium]